MLATIASKWLMGYGRLRDVRLDEGDVRPHSLRLHDVAGVAFADVYQFEEPAVSRACVEHAVAAAITEQADDLGLEHSVAEP